MGDPGQMRRRAQGARPGNRLLIVGAAVVVVLMAMGQLAGVYVDWLWFQSVQMESVFATRIIAQVVLFAIFGVLFFAVFMVNVMLAMRLAARQDLVARLLGWIQPDSRGGPLMLLSVGVGIVLALMVGAGMAGSWDTVLRFQNPTSFGTTDPIFGQDVSFFTFSLPMYELLQAWFMATIFLSLLGSLGIYVVKLVLPQLTVEETAPGEQRLDISFSLDFGGGIRAHVLSLVALLALGLAVGTWLNIYELVYEPTGLVFGAGYADIHAVLPAMWLMVAAAVLFAVLVLVSIGRRGYKLALTGLVVWIGVSILGGSVYPSMIQRLEVQPSELDKERPYIEYNIGMTNHAYALDRISEMEYPAEDAVTAAEVASNPGTIKNVRLWDPEPLLNTYNQIQSIRLYYDFLDVDVDRYMIDGEYRQVMVSARELSPSNLPTEAQTWVNRRLQYTHGYGVAMSPVNEVTPEGLPEMFLRDVPPSGKVPVSRPEIYYGENTNDYVIVKTDTPEFDYPKGDDNVYVRYEGESGVDIGSLTRRLLFSWHFGDANILLTGSMSSDSKILYNRNITERARMVAPFLTYDRDPYVVVANEQIYWILDAYTYTDRYPYSQPVNLGSRVNYLRNSVKVVMDAYDGSMRFYLADTSDPLIHTYSAIFPGLFAPLDEMPQEIREHLRYPQDLFSVQADLYRTYHMRDARVFYNKEDLWNIPNEIYADQQVLMEPYYVIMRLPGEDREEFALILPYTPPNKDNMITWLAARSDGDAYGTLVAYKYPKEKLIFGPLQIEARIDQDPRISEQLTLWNQAGSNVIRGNMIVIPIGQSNLYVEPIYLQSEQTKLPEMKRVVLATGNRVVMEPTVNTALAQLLTGLPVQVAEPTSTDPTTPPSTPGKPELGEAAKALLDRYAKLQEDMKALESDLKSLLESLDITQ